MTAQPEALTTPTNGITCRVWHWATSFFSPQRVPVDVRVDRTATYLVALDRDKGPRRRPVEPSIAVKEGRIVAVRGRAGRGVDSAALVSAMPDAATRGVPLEVAAGRRAVPPRFDLADARRVAAEAETLAGRPLGVTAGKAKATLTPAIMRPWMRAVPTFDRLVVQTDPQAQYVFVADQLNIHQSAGLVELVSALCGLTEDLGKKGKRGVLKSMKSKDKKKK